MPDFVIGKLYRQFNLLLKENQKGWGRLTIDRPLEAIRGNEKRLTYLIGSQIKKFRIFL